MIYRIGITILFKRICKYLNVFKFYFRGSVLGLRTSVYKFINIYQEFFLLSYLLITLRL